MPAWFWIIFDTSQLMKYYEDVHNLLAQPIGSTIRYNYKLSLISESARTVLNKPSAPILFLYVQKASHYERGEQYSVAPQGDHLLLCVATRIGNMLNVTKDAESYYFDFQVQGYPLQGKELPLLMGELNEKGEQPWSKVKNGRPYGPYVCTSNRIESLNNLSKGDEQANWSDIVQALSIDPMQFKQDAFWRMKGPYLRGSDAVLSPRIETTADNGKERQSQAIYHVRENSSWRLELVSEVGREAAPPAQVIVEGTVNDDKAVKFVGNSSFSLRRYSGAPVEFRSLTAELLGASYAEMTFRTTPQPTDWVTGATFSLKFRVIRNRVRMTVGIVAGIAGASAYVIGDSKILDCYPKTQILLKISAIIFGALSVFALTGALTFSGK